MCAQNYAAGTPSGGNGVPLYGSPAPFKAIATSGNTNPSASSVAALSDNTTAVEIATAGTGGVIMKWVATTETSPSVFGVSSVGATNAPNFDHAIPPNTVRRFVVPIESAANTTFGATITSVQGQNRALGLFRRLAVVSTGGTSSVLLTEYGNSNSY